MTDTPKKRGRPVGSGKKLKRYAITQTELKLANKLGVSTEDYVNVLVENKLIKPLKTDWQKLAKQLQAALESQIDDYTILETKLEILEKEANEFAESHRRYITIISYLETKLGLNPI